MTQLFSFIKFQKKKEYLTNLMDSGEVYFNSLNIHRQSNEQERGDSYECASKISNVELTSISCNHPVIGNRTFQIEPNSLSKIVYYNSETFLSFSLYALTNKLFTSGLTSKIDNRMIEFGDYALVIREPIIFLNSICAKLKELEIEYESHYVNYHDYSKKGDLKITPFDKTDELQHQFEYRIIIRKSNNEDYRKIYIGSIKDYCQLLDSKSLIEAEWTAKIAD